MAGHYSKYPVCISIFLSHIATPLHAYRFPTSSWSTSFATAVTTPENSEHSGNTGETDTKETATSTSSCRNAGGNCNHTWVLSNWTALNSRGVVFEGAGASITRGTFI